MKWDIKDDKKLDVGRVDKNIKMEVNEKEGGLGKTADGCC